MKNKVILIIVIALFACGLAFASYFVNREETNNKAPNKIESSGSGKESTAIEPLFEDQLEEKQNIEQVQESNSTAETQEVAEIFQVTSENFEEEVIKSDKLVLIDFYADWCPPCQMLSPIIDEVAMENSDVKFVRVNTDDEEELASHYRIMYLPTLVIIENGEEVDRSIGYIEKSDVEKLIKK